MEQRQRNIDRVTEILSCFNISTTAYKTVNNQEINLDVLIPKDVGPGLHPVAVRFHGGGLVTGSSLYLDWLACWVMEVALKHSAVLIAPNHRLLPESTGLNIMEDVSDVWKWVQNDLQPYVSHTKGGEQIKIDLSRLWAHGESAGGYLSIQSGLMLPPNTLRVVSAGYSLTSFSTHWYAESAIESFRAAPKIPATLIDDHLATMVPGRIVTAPTPPDRLGLTFALTKYGRKAEFVGTDPLLHPFQAIKTKKDFPPLFIYHGIDDSVVPMEMTIKFVEVSKAHFPDNKIVSKFVPGDHGFDIDTRTDEPWLKEGIEFIEKEWLR